MLWCLYAVVEGELLGAGKSGTIGVQHQDDCTLFLRIVNASLLTDFTQSLREEETSMKKIVETKSRNPKLPVHLIGIVDHWIKNVIMPEG